MCGIAGALGELGDARAAMHAARQSLHHRGPDDSGLWVDENASIALAHTRLSIVDLSSAGHQPMTSACGRYVIVFNGEIYNHPALRQELENVEPQRWRGHSD